MTSLCILTPDPDYEEDWRSDASRIKALLGDQVHFESWTQPVELKPYQLVMPLLVWGYQRDPARWYAALEAWEAQALPMANPPALLRWNTDKRYLFDLAAQGIAIVPSRFSAALTEADVVEARAAFGREMIVIKPIISGGSDGTYLLAPRELVPDDVAGQPMLIQPMLDAIATEGEYSLFYLGGHFSHAIVKRPRAGDFRVQEQFGGTERAVDPEADVLQLANQAFAALAYPALYARIDLVRGNDGAVVLMELEAIEPSLFLHHAPDGGAQFARAVESHLAAQFGVAARPVSDRAWP